MLDAFMDAAIEEAEKGLRDGGIPTITHSQDLCSNYRDAEAGDRIGH